MTAVSNLPNFETEFQIFKDHYQACQKTILPEQQPTWGKVDAIMQHVFPLMQKAYDEYAGHRACFMYRLYETNLCLRHRHVVPLHLFEKMADALSAALPSDWLKMAQLLWELDDITLAFVQTVYAAENGDENWPPLLESSAFVPLNYERVACLK